MTKGATTLAVGLICLELPGCMALRLSSLGAPEEEMREFELRLAGLDLPATHEGGHETGLTTQPLWVTVPESGWLHGYDVRLVDGQGHTVPSDVVHHFKVMDPHRRELFSPIMLHLAGGGAETKPVSLPRQAGVPLEQGDSLLVTAMLHNPTGRDLEDVQLTLIMHYSPRGPWEAPLAVLPFFTHVTPPMSEPGYDLPPGRSQRSLEITPAVAGWIIGIGGHLHQYGVLLRLEDVTEGEVLWEKKPLRSASGVVLEVPYDRFVSSRGPTLRPEHTYRVTAFYDNPTEHTIPNGGMGTLGGAFVAEEPWPAVDHGAREYAWYMERETTSREAPEHVHPPHIPH